MTKLKTFKIALEKFAKIVIANSKQELKKQNKSVTGQLANSLGYEIDERADSVILSFIDKMGDEGYADFVDKGVSGTEQKYNTPYSYKDKKPPAKNIIDWVRSRRFQFQDRTEGKKGRFLSYAQTGYIVRNSIFRKGIEPSLFFTTPFQKRLKDFPKDIFQELIVEIDDKLRRND